MNISNPFGGGGGEEGEGEKKEGEKEGEGGGDAEPAEDKDNRTDEEKAEDAKRLKELGAAQGKAAEALLKKKEEMAKHKRNFRFICQNMSIENLDDHQHDPYLRIKLGGERKTVTVNGKKKKQGKKPKKFWTEKMKRMKSEEVRDSIRTFQMKWKGYYKDLDDQHLTIEVWDWDRWTPNDKITEVKYSLAELANASVSREIEFEISKAKDDEEMIPYIKFKAEIIFDEIFPWELMFTEWTGAALKAADMIGGVPTTSDPYIKFQIPVPLAAPRRKGYKYGRKVKTNVVRSTLYPQWDDIHKPLYYTGTLSQLDNEILIVDVYDWDLIGKDDLIGQARIPMNGVLEQGFLQIALALEEDEYEPSDDEAEEKDKKKDKKKKKKKKKPEKKKGAKEKGKGKKNDKKGKGGKKSDKKGGKKGGKKKSKVKADDEEEPKKKPKKKKKTGNRIWNDVGTVQGFIKPKITPLYKQTGAPVIRRPDVTYLGIHIVAAEQLKAADPSGLSDPFFTAEWDGSIVTSTVQKKTLNPKFNETLWLGVKAAKITEDVMSRKGVVKIKCFDWDESGSCDFLGGCQLSLDSITEAKPAKESSLTKGRMFNGVLPLELPGTKSEASVTINAWFAPDLPIDFKIQAEEHKKIKTLPKNYLARRKEWLTTVPNANLSNDKTQKYMVRETDDESNARFLCSYLYPVMTPKSVNGQLASKQTLARVTACITHASDDETLGVEDQEYWVSPTFFLDMAKGDADSHAIFLCNLFLGMGLDAYVCVGAVKKHIKQHQWVMVRNHDGSVELWEVTNAKHYILPGRWVGTDPPDEDGADDPSLMDDVMGEAGAALTEGMSALKGLAGQDDEKEDEEEKEKDAPKKKKRRKRELTALEQRAVWAKEAQMIFMDGDDVYSAHRIQEGMAEDPEDRPSGIELNIEEVEEVIVVEDWESLVMKELPYESLDLVFNRQDVWANVGHKDPGKVRYNLDDDDKWTPFVGTVTGDDYVEPTKEERDEDGNFLPFYKPRPVLAPAMSADKLKQLEKEILEELKSGYKNYREDKSLPYELNADVSAAGRAVLNKMENDMLLQTPQSRNQLQGSKMRLKAKLPEDCNFKGQPTCFKYSDSKMIKKHVMEYTSYQDEQNEKAEFVLSVKAIGYPQNVTPVWVLVGVIVPRS